MSNSLQLYFDFLSQPSRALYIILKTSGTPFEECHINLLQGDNLSEEYKSEINRFQKAPAIIDGIFKLAESIAILRYLTAKGCVSSHFYPSDLKKRARIDEFLSWQHNGVRSSCSLYFRFTWVQERITGSQAAAGKVAKYKLEMESDLQTIETLWLEKNLFLTGDELTAADVFGACEVEQLRVTGYNLREKFPKVFNWVQLVRQQLQPHYDIAHRTVYHYEKDIQY